MALGGVLLALSLALPLVRDVRVADGIVSVSFYDILQGRYPVVGRFAAWLVVGAVAFLLSMLMSRRTGLAMTASRPTLWVVSLAPVVGAALPFLRLHRYGQHPGVGVAVGFVFAGVFLALMGSLRFGQGVHDHPRSEHSTDD